MWCIPDKYYPSVIHYAEENILCDSNIQEWRLYRNQVWTIYGDKREIVMFPVRKNFVYFLHMKLHEDDGMIMPNYKEKFELIKCPIYILTNACEKQSEFRNKATHFFRTKARSHHIETGMIFRYYGVPFLIKKYVKNKGFLCSNIRSNKLIYVSTYDIRTKGEFLKKDESI